MKISVCLPVIGRPRLLEQALCSLLGQGHQDWELVLKDGGPDQPVAADERIKKLLDLVGSSRLRHQVSKDAGIFWAFNECFQLATGKVIYAMCSDDLLVPGALEAVSAAFEADRFPTTMWVYGKTVSADITGRKQGVDGETTNFDAMLQHNRLGLPAVFWGRGLMALEGGFDTRYRCSADYELYLRCWRRREPTFLDQELGVFRHHDVQWSKVHEAQLDAEVEKIKQRHRFMGDVILSARNTVIARRAYTGNDMPWSVN